MLCIFKYVYNIIIIYLISVIYLVDCTNELVARQHSLFAGYVMGKSGIHRKSLFCLLSFT